MVSATPKSLFELERMSEADLENIINQDNSDDARFVLGRLSIEGTNDNIPKNINKGKNWLKEAVKNDHLGAIEYQTYYDIRFNKQPNVKKIQQNLEMIVKANKSTRACNTMAEFMHAQNKLDNYKEEAAKYYSMSAEQGCFIGTHWMGVFYQEGFGVARNLNKSIEFLKKSARAGNGQSAFQLFLIYSKEDEVKDNKIAYKYLTKAVESGVTYFEQMNTFFKENQDELAPVFIASRNLPSTVDVANKKEIENLHDAYVNEMQMTFNSALSKDRLYLRAAGFMTDQQIWMVGLLTKYLVKTVLRFDHADFLDAIKRDLGPILGEVGLWSLKNYQAKQASKKNENAKKMCRTATDLIKNYLENGLDYLGKENKYNLTNRFGPKKCASEQIKRHEIANKYSWIDYAPLKWHEHLIKQEDDLKNAKENKGKNPFALCSHCGSPESQTIKHKRCSQCKQRLYCSADCQKFDWKSGHSKECKKMAAEAKAKAK